MVSMTILVMKIIFTTVLTGNVMIGGIDFFLKFNSIESSPMNHVGNAYSFVTEP